MAKKITEKKQPRKTRISKELSTVELCSTLESMLEKQGLVAFVYTLLDKEGNILGSSKGTLTDQLGLCTSAQYQVLKKSGI